MISEHLSAEELRGLYAAGDAFVLPSRGEGWGRPHVEAMAMGLPGAHQGVAAYTIKAAQGCSAGLPHQGTFCRLYKLRHTGK